MLKFSRKINNVKLTTKICRKILIFLQQLMIYLLVCWSRILKKE